MSSSIPHLDAKPTATAVAILGDRLVVNLADGRELRVPLEWFGWLDDATPEQKQDVRLIEGGRGIWWESVDEGVSVPWLFGLPHH
jgi:hypothetical protein